MRGRSSLKMDAKLEAAMHIVTFFPKRKETQVSPVGRQIMGCEPAGFGWVGRIVDLARAFRAWRVSPPK